MCNLNLLLALTILLAGALIPLTVQSQDYGNVKTYGPTGQLFSVTKSGELTRESYLLSERPLSGEDGFYIEGDLRQALKYENGGYEIKLMRFFVTCTQDGLPEVRQWEGDESGAETVTIKGADRMPAESLKDAHNLYWAVCQKQFNKFGSVNSVRSITTTSGGFVRYLHRDLPGNDIRTIKNTTLATCVSDCDSDTKCRAYSFDRWNRWCFLKGSPDSPGAC
jgi:hypothetical protein